MDSYEASLKVFRDLKNTYDYAVQTARNEGLSEGLSQGLVQGKANVAGNLKALSIDADTIAKSKGLTREEIEDL